MTDVLVVEDDDDVAFALTVLLRANGHTARIASSLRSATAALEGGPFSAVLLDLGLPDGDALEALPTLMRAGGTAPFIVTSGRDQASSAVRALRAGAVDYLTKPFSEVALRGALETAIRRGPRAVIERPVGPAFAIGRSPSFVRAVEMIRAAARSPKTPVLVTGESGTGKEVAASMVHALGARAAAPFVTVNAACLPDHLLESELFGHEAGAFTGAQKLRRGLFEMAAGGTLFLDEVGELPLALQPKLLRVLDGHPYRRVGGERELTCTARIVAATNRDLEREVKDGRFRADLYHRLLVLSVRMPPLRERREDVPELARHFLAQIAEDLGQRPKRLGDGTLGRLTSYAWPGNVRELRNALERAVVLAPGDVIDEDALALTPERDDVACDVDDELEGDDLLLRVVVDRHVHSVFEREGRNLTRAAKALGISRATLREKLRLEASR